MFSKIMNNFYYGKSGKGDYTPENLPTNRWQLFWEMLRVRAAGLFKLNLAYMLCWLPTIVVLLLGVMSVLTSLTTFMEGGEMTMSLSDMFSSVASTTLLLLVPCIAITGPFTSGMCYVTRNWARDEHSFIWSDFKDAMKTNWKQSLVISLITGMMPLMVYVCWNFYGALAAENVIMVLPQVLTLMIAIIWSLAVTYFHPLIVCYKLSMSDVLRNGILLAIARLPMSIGIRLLHCVPMLIAVGLAFFVNPIWCVLGLCLYYILIGFSLSRFITASFTNAVFDRFINAKIEGAKVNRGLYTPEDDEDDEDDEEEDGADQQS